jgi:TP901 family phage tail tape measure protein
MADINSNIFINIDTAQAMSAVRALDKQLSAFNRSMVVGTRAAQSAQADFTRSLLHNVNATGAFTGSMAKMSTSVDQFSKKLDTGKLSIREYYRYSMASSKSFGRFFGKEFDTVGNLIQKRVKTLQSQYVGLGRDAQGALNAMRMSPKKLNYNDQLTQMQMMIQRQQIFNKLLDDGSTRLLNFGKNTQWAGRQLMVGFTIPLAMFAAGAVKSFKEIETQAIRFKKVYGEIFTTQEETNAALKNMQKVADEYTKYGLKVSETIKTAADAAAAGNVGKDLEEIVRQANKLAVLGGVAQDKSLETIIALKNAFGITAAELGKNIDFLNAVENQTVLTIEDLTNAIPRVAPVIKQLGGDVKDLSFFLTAMKEGGVSAEQGANALKSGLASLINPSKAAVEATSALGINLKAIVESNAGDLKRTVLEFAQSLSTLNDLQRGQIIEKVFGKYQFARLSAMFNNITKEGTQANRVMKLATASAEELAILSQRELKTQESSAMNRMQQQIEKLKAAIAPIGELFAKTLTPILEFFVKLLNKFNELPDGVKKVVTLIVAGIAGIGPVILMTVGLVANGVANLMKMFNLVRQGYQRLAYGSKDAALGTRYMTQEELENTAVTNALANAHENLSAAYVLESSSLRALTGVYQQANAAMMTFSKNNPGMFMPGLPKGGGRPPRKYNKGVSYVPGSGNRDTVPAMLTPGEAVIPKGMVKKHGGLVSSIVDDNVPGYMAGVRSVFPMLANQPKVVGNLNFAATQAISKNPARSLSLVEQQFASLSSMKIGTPNARGLIPVDLGGGVTFFVNRKKIDSFKSELMRNEEYQLARGDSPDDILRTVRAAISKPDRKLIGSVVSPSRIKNITPYGQGLRTRAVPKEVTSRRRLYKNSPQYQAIVAEHESEISYLKSIAGGPNAYGLTLDDLVTVSRGSRKGREDFGYAPAFSHRQKADSQLFSSTTRNRPSNIFEEHSFLNKFFEENKAILGGIHVARRDQAETVVAALSGIKNKSASQKAAQAIFERRLSTGFYDADKKNFGRRSSQYSLLKSSGMTAEEISSLPGVPGYMRGIASVPKNSLFLGMPLTAKQVAVKRDQQSVMEQISAAVEKSRFAGLSPTTYGEQISSSIGRSFPVPGIGGTYRNNNGDLVFVKPVVDEISALAEMRATKIAREAHGLKSPNQSIKTMLDPTDPSGKRKLLVLESPVEEQFANMTGKFTSNQYIKQLVASALRGDKDLQMSNLSGNVLADVGTAGVFEKASGVRAYANNMPSMAEQAKINLLGVKGGAKRFFAESTLDIARSMTPAQYDAAIRKEITATIPKLKKSIQGMNLDPKEQAVYDKMVTRLEEGLNVNWAEYHAVHSSVVPQAGKKLSAAQILEQEQKRQLLSRQSGHANKTPYRYNKGVFSVPGSGNQDTVPAMLTPGEAVIPKGMAKKYAPLVDGIITDSIPGHKKGKKTGIPKPLPGQTFDGPSVVRPNWRRRVQNAQAVIKPMASQALDKANTKLISATLKTSAGIEKFESGVSRVGSGFKTLTQNTKTLTQSTRAISTEFGKDKTRGVRGWMSGYGKVPQTIQNEDGSSRRATPEERKNMRQDRRMASSNRMMGIGMASMMVPMVAGAAAANNSESGFGKFASENMMAITAASMLPMLMPLFNAPWKKLALGVAALVGLYKMQSMQIKKSIQNGLEQGRAIGNTVASLEEFGKITGTVSATQIQEEKRRRGAVELSPVSETFGRQFRGSEFGKKFIEDFTKSAQGPGIDAANILGTKLAGAISQGVLSSSQAESIIANIARANNDQILEIEAMAVLRKIIGPGGEDLSKNPIEVQTRILLNNAEIQKQLQQSFLNVVQKESGINMGEAKQLGVGAVGGLAVGGYAGVKAAKGMGAALTVGKNVQTAYQATAAIRASEDLTKLSKTIQTTSKVFTGLRAARAAAAAGTVATGATGVGIPVAVGLGITTAILSGVEFGVRKWQKGKEKEKIGAVAGVVSGSQIQNLQAVTQAIDAITQNEDIQIEKLKTELKIAKTAEDRLRIEQQIKDVKTESDTGRQDLSAQIKTIFDGTTTFVESLTSEDAKTKIRETYDIAYTDYFKNAVGQQKLDSVNLDAMLNPDSGLLKTEGLRGPVDKEALSKAQAELANVKTQLNAALAISRDPNASAESRITAASKADYLTKYDLQEANKKVSEASQGAKTNITDEQALAFRLNIQSAIVSGALSVSAATALISTMNANGEDYTQALTLRLETQSPQEVNRLGNLLTFVNDKNKATIEVETRGLNAAELGEFNTGLEEFAKLPDDVGINVDLEVNNKSEIADIKKFGKEIAALKEQFPDGKVTRTTLELYQKSIGGPGKNATVDTGLKDFAILEKYAPELRVQGMLTLQTLELSDSFKAEVDTAMQKEFSKLNPSLKVDSTEFKTGFAAWKQTEEGKAFKLDIEPKMKNDALALILQPIQEQIEAQEAAAALAAAKAAAERTKSERSWIKDLLLDLKLLKAASIDVEGGITELQRVLAGKTGQRIIDKETGVIPTIQKLAKGNKVKGKAAPIDLSPDLIEQIKGLDEKELARFTKDFLTTTGKGKNQKITGLQLNRFNTLNDSYKQRAIGGFLDEQTTLNKELSDQSQLFIKLTDPVGNYKWSIEQATWAMEDAAVANALLTKSQIDPADLEAINKKYAERVKLLAGERRNKGAGELSDIGNQSKTLSLLTKAGVNFTDALDISKIQEYADEIALAYTAADATGKMTAERAEEIRNKFKGYIEDVKALREAAFNREQQSETRSDKRTDQFAAEAARVTVASQAMFRLQQGMSVDQYGIGTREQEVLLQQHQDSLEEYNKGLTSIDKLEASVNEKYDAKIKLIDQQSEALNKVLSLNEDIAAQQQNQLTLADALTSGDISAAAAAAEAYSAKQADIASRSAGDALTTQRDNVEAQRQKDLDSSSVRINGILYTRKQLTEEIARFQEQTIDPLEKEIDARNRLVAAYELGLDKAIKNIEIQGMTADEWSAIGDAVSLLNDAYDSQVIDIDLIAKSATGLAGAWLAVTNQITAATLEVGKYPGFKQEAPPPTYGTETKVDKDGNSVEVYTDGPKKGYTKDGKLFEPYVAPSGTRGGNKWQAMALMSKGGLVPKYFASGGYAKGTDTVPAMLTPGEFVIRKSVADQYRDLLHSLNGGTYKTLESPTFNSMKGNPVSVGAGGGSSSSISDNSSRVYNYNVGISVNGTSASADDIAKAVMAEIKYVDSQRLRGQR